MQNLLKGFLPRRESKIVCVTTLTNRSDPNRVRVTWEETHVKCHWALQIIGQKGVEATIRPP